MTTKPIQPDRLFQRALKGHTLYSHVVIASGKTLVFIAGQVSRDKERNVVGAGDMAAQIRQVGKNGQALPTSTTVEVRRLSHLDMMVEVEALAVIDIWCSRPFPIGLACRVLFCR